MASRFGPRDRSDREWHPSVGSAVPYGTPSSSPIGRAAFFVARSAPGTLTGRWVGRYVAGSVPSDRLGEVPLSEPMSARPDGAGRVRNPGPAPIGTSPASSAGARPPELAKRDAVARALEAFGLRKSTSRLYCAALAVGPALPLEIIVSARVRRATGYRGLERLRRMELVVPVAHRPLRVEAVPLDRFLNRSAFALLDEVELHREMREVAAEALSRPTSGRSARAPVLIGASDAARVLRESLALARSELWAVPVFRGFPRDARAAIRDGLEAAVARGVRVRALIPYERPYLNALPTVAGAAGPDPRLEVRLSEPAFFHLYVIDSTKVIRFFVRSTPLDRPSGTLGVVSERRSFIQGQEARFRTLWSEAPNLRAEDDADEDVGSSS